ncbi:phosphatidylserine decarboxylase [Campylobacter hyointestinalis]|uniref:phosphatidylserine decarboxylase n=1 Tax=Campylobacter hyointestinalis TaxID=198 RepID=UPI000CE356F8|nr:phosphatidylserine decarboxylase [Campylobacter hyointestinalis]PPB72749.1 phosphatidylserine decarboxylase [Campylobacter hyointestinalis subsp. hyointestinalis]PPB74880.1 phosphatidylserine decarboxylase [Campylobacter hyointestinalis subsp. hyointestinalis]PPB76792.1 phosphatidylserine decarboxylase [Campylobacter hyointestinalis subsp. hyointestinalis]PPB77285.1 phosphatidylserine decarboxylase [Campylobacter hyointestinalis subsp. hyointestinalis]
MDNLRVINRYGYISISIFGALFLLSLLFEIYEYFFGLLFLASIFIYRNPERMVEVSDDKAIFSPVDGKIISIKRTIYAGDEYLEVSIRNHLCDCGVLRSVANLKIDEIKKKNGLNLFSSSDAKNLLSNRVAYICSVINKKIAIKICSGVISRKIHYENAKELKAGARIGFIVDGKVSVLLPVDTTLKISTGDKIKACDLIGFLGEDNGK